MKACFRGKGLFSLLLVSVLLLSAGPSALAAGGGEQLDMLVPADPETGGESPASGRLPFLTNYKKRIKFF